MTYDPTVNWAFERDWYHDDIEVTHRSELLSSPEPLAPLFIDWITVQQVYPLGGLNPVNSGRVFAIDEDGAVEWEVERDMVFEGSHDSRIKIQCDGFMVKVSGNVGRFDRPDNIFGFELDETMRKANRILAQFNLPPFTKGEPFREYGYEFFKWTGALFTRLDLTCNFSTGSEANVAPFMQHLAASSVSRMRTGAFPDGHTVDYGRGSKYWYAKAYAKYFQLTSRQQKKRQPPQEVLDFVRDAGMVRFELTLKSRYLTQNGFRYWGGTEMSKLCTVFEDKAEVVRREKPILKAFDRMIEGLSIQVQETVMNWQKGKHLPSLMKRATYYRHRREILDHCGFDISLPFHVVDLSTRYQAHQIDVLPMVAPDWYWQRTGIGI